MVLKRPKPKSTLERYLPIVGWLPSYDWKGAFRYDIIAALTVWSLLVPEAMAYAGIAGVPPEVGLVTAPLALVGYAVFGSSKQLFVGPSSTVAIISASVVAPLAAGDESLYLVITIWLAIFTGILFLGMGLARMGWISHFMASSVLAGFMVGLAIVIAVSQLDHILGVEADGTNAVTDVGSMLLQFSDWNWATIAVGSASLASLFLIEEFIPRVPGALIVMIIAIAASAAFGWEDLGIHTIGEIPAELPQLAIPAWQGWDLMSEVLVGALAVVVVAFAESFAAAKTYADKSGDEIDANSELVGLGVANLGAGLSGGFAVDGGLSKTAVAAEAGQRTQMAGLLVAAATLVTIVALTPLFEPLPEATLAAIVIHSVWNLIDFSKFGRLFRIRQLDLWLAIAAFLGVLLIGIIAGIVVGIVLSLVVLIYKDSFPEGAELGRLTEGSREVFGSIDNNPDAKVLPGVVLFRQAGSLIFSNSAALSDQVKDAIWQRTDPEALAVVIDCEQIADMDVTGAETLISLNDELTAAGVAMFLVRLRADAAVTAERAGVLEAIGPNRVFATVGAAADTLMDEGLVAPGGWVSQKPSAD